MLPQENEKQARGCRASTKTEFASTKFLLFDEVTETTKTPHNTDKFNPPQSKATFTHGAPTNMKQNMKKMLHSA